MNFTAFAARYARVRPKKAYVALPLLIMAALYGLSSVPGTRSPEDSAIVFVFYWLPPSVQNVLHIPAYAALAWAWHWALGAWSQASTARAIAAFCITTSYGVFDEWHQSWVPGRYASVTDVLFNAAGAALGIWLAAWTIRYVTSSATGFGARNPPEQ